ncbi:MAG: glutamate--tRNA ligase, partial [Acidobacteriota bacterium]
MARPVRTRIAPSPTGDPHVGTAYVALFNLAFARQHGGQFILRIEDTDRVRSDAASEAMIFDALRWLGLEWDEGPDVGGPHGPYRQSERAEIYREHAERLVASGDAYPCFCTKERLDALRAEQREKKLAFGYDGHCRSIPPEEAERRRKAGEAHVIRLAMPREGESVVRDLLRGVIRFPNEQIDDQVLLKSDGFPTYHLANVVDDHLMEVSHVIRAEEWISSLPKHVRLYGAFGWDEPVFCHLPLLRNADRSKISKRKNPVSLNYYRRAGYLPEAMLNYLALMGWTLPDEREEFTLEEFIDAFDLGRVSLGGPVFDLDKLTWLNGRWIRRTPVASLRERLRADV